MQFRRYSAALMLLCLIAAGSLQAQESRSQIESVIRDTLNSMNSYGWDSVNQGILINWSRSDPMNRVNCATNGQCDARLHPTRHDSQNDIRDLQHLYWWKWRFNGNPYYDQAIARLVPTVKRKMGDTTMGKGWIYFVLQRLSEYADTPADRAYWTGVMRHWATAQYADIDPKVGVRHGRTGNCACGARTIYFDDAYRSADQIEIGAALVSAGTRFDQPDWVTAGWKQVQMVYRQAFVPRYNLFGRIFILQDPKYGHDVLWDPEVKIGEASEEADALLRAGAATDNPSIREDFWGIASKMLTALAESPIHDRRYGGFYFAFYVAKGPKGKPAGTVTTNVKESRQLSILGTYHIANALMPGHKTWVAMEVEMLRVLTHTPSSREPGMYLPNLPPFRGKVVNGYPASVAGYAYELRSNYQLVDHQNWVTSEADNLALLGLQEEVSPTPRVAPLTSSSASKTATAPRRSPTNSVPPEKTPPKTTSTKKDTQ